MKKNVVITNELANEYKSIRNLFKVSPKTKDAHYTDEVHKQRANALRQLLKNDIFLDFIQEATEDFRSYFSASEDANISFDLLRSSKTCLLETISSTDTLFKSIATGLTMLEDRYQYDKELDGLLSVSSFINDMSLVIEDYMTTFTNEQIWTQYSNKLRKSMTSPEKGLNDRLFNRMLNSQKPIFESLTK